MKIPVIISSIAVMSLVTVAGCNKQPGPDDTENPVNEELTAEEQKSKLIDVATEFIGVFDAANQKDAVEAFDWIIYHYMDYSWSEVGDYYDRVLDDIMGAAARSARSLSEGHFTANAAMEIYEFPDFTGIFEANDDTESWEYVGESDNITLRCKDRDGNPAEVVLTASGEEMEFEYEYWDYDDVSHPFTAVVPSNISLSAKVDGNEYITFDFNFDAEKSSHVKINTEVKITNIVYNLEVSVEKTSVSTECTLKYGDRILLAVSAAAPSCVLAGKGDNMDWEEWWYKYCDAFEYGDSDIEFGNLIATANILSQVQVRAESNDPADIYHALMDLDEKYENDYGYRYYDTREYNLECSDLINSNMNISLYYSSDIEQAEVITKVFSDEGYSDTYYYIAPVVRFPKDGTTYAFDEYFTESAFGSVIQLAEDLVNKYISLLRYNDIDPVDL